MYAGNCRMYDVSYVCALVICALVGCWLHIGKLQDVRWSVAVYMM